MNCTDKIIAKGTLRNLRNSWGGGNRNKIKKKIQQQIFLPSLSVSSQKSLCQNFLTGDKSKEASQDEKTIDVTLKQKQIKKAFETNC